MERDKIAQEYNVIDGVVRAPGKFEGEAAFVPYFYAQSLDGGADTEYSFDGGYYMEFEVTAGDREEYPVLDQFPAYRTVRLVENHDGFVYEVQWTPEPAEDASE